MFSPILYLIHDLVVGSSQSQIHGVHVLGEVEFAGMLTVSWFTEGLAGHLCLLHIQRPNRNPTESPHEVVILTLVLVLKRRRRGRGVSTEAVFLHNLHSYMK